MKRSFQLLSIKQIFFYIVGEMFSFCVGEMSFNETSYGFLSFLSLRMRDLAKRSRKVQQIINGLTCPLHQSNPRKKPFYFFLL